MAAPERTRIPERWSLPESIRDRLGENLGRARAMVAEQHLLLILHAVPRGAASEGVVFHRDPMGAWQSTERGGLGALEALVTDDSTGGFRVPDDILSMIDRVPVARAAGGRLRLRVQDGVLEMDGRELVIGAGESCNLVLRHPGVQEQQARIVEIEGRYLLLSEDLQSENYRNGERADGVELLHGDLLAFGRGGPEARVEIG